MVKTKNRRRNRFRPQVEVLEERELLATYIWTGQLSGDWHSAPNWSADGAPAQTPPGASDDVWIDLHDGGLFGRPDPYITNSTSVRTMHSMNGATSPENKPRIYFKTQGASLTMTAGVSTWDGQILPWYYIGGTRTYGVLNITGRTTLNFVGGRIEVDSISITGSEPIFGANFNVMRAASYLWTRLINVGDESNAAFMRIGGISVHTALTQNVQFSGHVTVERLANLNFGYTSGSNSYGLAFIPDVPDDDLPPAPFAGIAVAGGTLTVSTDQAGTNYFYSEPQIAVGMTTGLIELNPNAQFEIGPPENMATGSNHWLVNYGGIVLLHEGSLLRLSADGYRQESGTFKVIGNGTSYVSFMNPINGRMSIRTGFVTIGADGDWARLDVLNGSVYFEDTSAGTPTKELQVYVNGANPGQSSRLNVVNGILELGHSPETWFRVVTTGGVPPGGSLYTVLSTSNGAIMGAFDENLIFWNDVPYTFTQTGSSITLTK